MAGISSFGVGVGAAPVAPPPAPLAAEGHNDGDTVSPLVDLLERFPELFAQKVLRHLDPIDRTFLEQVGGACRAAVAASDLPRAGSRAEVLGINAWVVTHKLTEFLTSVGRGLHSSTLQLNVSAFCGVRGTCRGCLGGV